METHNELILYSLLHVPWWQELVQSFSKFELLSNLNLASKLSHCSHVVCINSKCAIRAENTMEFNVYWLAAAGATTTIMQWGIPTVTNIRLSFILCFKLSLFQMLCLVVSKWPNYGDILSISTTAIALAAWFFRKCKQPQ